MNFELPDLGEGICEAELVEWLVTVGEVVEHGQSLAEVMTDKATLEIPSPFSGMVIELRAEPGDGIKVGQALLSYESSNAVELAETQKQTVNPEKSGNGRGQRIGELATLSPTNTTVRAAPSVRRMARQMGIDLARVWGSGPGGRVLIDDVTGHARSSNLAPPIPTADTPVRSHEAAFQPGTRVKLRGIRRRTAEHMVEAKHVIPHFSYVDECDVSQLVQIRESLRDSLGKVNVKLTYLPFFVKAVVAALREVPIVNSSLDDEAGEIILHDQYHIGIATETSRGLLVPVLHNADQLEFIEVARRLERLTTSAREGKIRREDMRGGTFSITSIGSIGGLISTPIINHPEAAILGIGRIVKRPIYDDAGNLHPADMVYLSLSLDHRIIDGASAAAFCNSVMKQLTNPASLLL
jgi:pyruvate/2-oxoglutarate dehydrogenase complex dihydrolipoamide acyltransferase (E2) component